MGRKVTPLELTLEQRKELEKAYQQTDSRKYARRCSIILRKSAADQPSNETIARELEIQELTVAEWVRRYRRQGIVGLTSKPIPGRPNILDPERDAALVKAYVKKSRQRLVIAHDQIEKAKGRKMSPSTLRRFLKSLAHDFEDYV